MATYYSKLRDESHEKEDKDKYSLSSIPRARRSRLTSLSSHAAIMAKEASRRHCFGLGSGTTGYVDLATLEIDHENFVEFYL